MFFASIVTEAAVMDQHVASVEFTDVVRRPIYEGDGVRQYVIDDEETKEYDA
jgi:hypothetical protein